MTCAVRLHAPPVELNPTPEQAAVLARVTAWLASRRPPFFTLGGYAGTGKTSLLAHLVQSLGTSAAVAALCGKAASVLRGKGVSHAQTIHSLIYAPFEDENGRVKFARKEHIDQAVVIVDEASMIDVNLHNDLLSFRVPVLYAGDHGQLQPIGRDAGLMLDPMAKLETVHRQAENNPILRFASAVREGRRVPSTWKDPEGLLTLRPRSEAHTHALGVSQVICAYNRTRHRINAVVRQRRGFRGTAPHVGERLVCLKNNRSFGIFNGQLAEVIRAGKPDGPKVDLCVYTDDGRMVNLPARLDQFGRDTDQAHRDEKVALFDYGYALTAHKAQGSEFDSVLVVEELSNLWCMKRWRYTAATRARTRLIYCG